MSKMTTEQFLSHLGIEVDKPFNVKDYDNIFTVRYGDISQLRLVFKGIGEDEEYFDELSWLLDKEITPLPKYTLTEDEKAIVRHFGKNFNWLCRDIYGHYLKFDGLDEEYRLPLETDIFHFVSISKPVSLDELRKCL